MNRMQKISSGLAAIVMGAAIREQMSRPPEQRTWQGTISGVPYDLRRPTLDRLRHTVWNKDNPRLIVPTFFGVGWTINLYPLVHRGS